MNYKKNTWHAYTSDSLAGTGDHPAEGGKVVKGVSGDIHIMSGIESDIMKIHGPEGEHILAQRKGGSIDNMRSDRNTGNKAYGLFGPSDQEQQGDTLEDMFQVSKANIISGTQTMFDFMDTTLQQQLDQFGYQEDLLGIQREGYGIQKERLDMREESLGADTTNVRRSMEQYGGGGQGQVKTGLQTNTDNIAIERLEESGVSAMDNIGLKRDEITLARKEVGLGMDTLNVRGNILESQMEGVETQTEIDKYNYTTGAGQQIAGMITAYMNATGEDVPDEMMSAYEEYMDTYGG